MNVYWLRSKCLSLFFFSSRRRHTRLQGDWSSDVCSSDLRNHRSRRLSTRRLLVLQQSHFRIVCRVLRHHDQVIDRVRSEERRVGKECRNRKETHAQNRKNENERMYYDAAAIDRGTIQLRV